MRSRSENPPSTSKCQDRRRDRPFQDADRVVELHAAENLLAVAAGADQRAESGGAHRDNGRRLDAAQDRARRHRQLDQPQRRGRRQAEPRRRLCGSCRHVAQPVSVLRTIGSKPYRTRAIRAGLTPVPPISGTRKHQGQQARAGMVCTTPATRHDRRPGGRRPSDDAQRHADEMPTITATGTIDTCSTVCTHRRSTDVSAGTKCRALFARRSLPTRRVVIRATPRDRPALGPLVERDHALFARASPPAAERSRSRLAATSCQSSGGKRTRLRTAESSRGRRAARAVAGCESRRRSCTGR